MSTPLKIAVIGAGLMGHGIAQVFAVAGHDVAVTDSHEPVLATVRDRIRANLQVLEQDAAAAERVRPVPDVRTAVAEADFVVEAAAEDLDVKRCLFAEIETFAPRDAILATNTSVIPISEIMRDLEFGHRAVGTHWWNPPFLVPLVEVIGTDRTAAEVIDRTMVLHTSIGKTPVHVKKDVPGFVGNRLQHALWREAISLVEHGICDAETVDTVVKSSFGRRLAVLGPLENADLVGTDLTLAIHRTVLPAIESAPKPSPYLEELVANGRLGMKSGIGFKAWTEEEQSATRKRILEYLKRKATD
jgi:3-hydroxybutyryl-CoA dehydrogenase